MSRRLKHVHRYTLKIFDIIQKNFSNSLTIHSNISFVMLKEQSGTISVVPSIRTSQLNRNGYNLSNL